MCRPSPARRDFVERGVSNVQSEKDVQQDARQRACQALITRMAVEVSTTASIEKREAR